MAQGAGDLRREFHLQGAISIRREMHSVTLVWQPTAKYPVRHYHDLDTASFGDCPDAPDIGACIDEVSVVLTFGARR